ncbi:sugar phosphate isomerase/epimerase family protein [Novosphingobium barchaimii]|uniref:sugar phosphate isomerase/epimerase family protein n=1 Tax=Novosphingobium barchaimii TaxID=1420591 RepID=UPI0014707E69|nr:TIM barrel protein [Novosphingobium barchaimii]
MSRHIELVRRLGVAAISPTLEDVEDFGIAAAASLLRETGLAVATVTHRAFGFATPDEARAARKRLRHTIAIAETIGAKTITITTGGRGDLTWAVAVERFASEIAACALTARNAGILLSLEPTSHLYADVSIAHRLMDTVRIARAAGINIGIDVFACWFDADIDDAIVAAAPHVALVQVSDYIAGDRELPCRAIPGDGMARLDRLIPLIHRAGFRGYYDLEVIGPRIAAEGAEAALARGVRYLRALLSKD